MHTPTLLERMLSMKTNIHTLIQRKRKAALSAILTIGLTASIISHAAAGERVVIGTPGSISDNSIAVKVAIDKGFYEEAGLDVELVNFKGGAPSIQALVGGGIQYAIAAPEHVTRLRQWGVDAVVAFALHGSHTYALLSAPGSDVKSFKDLIGKRVGITSSGSLTENLIRLEALDQNLTVGKDIEVVGAGVGAAQKAALDTNRIDAGMFGNIDALQLVEQGYQVVHDWRQESVPALALLTLESYQQENPAIVEAVTKATLKAQQLILSDRELLLSTLRDLYPDVSDEIIAKVADGLEKSLLPDGVFNRESYDRLQADLVQIEPELESLDYEVANPGTYLR